MREINRRLRVVLSYVLTVILVAGYPAATFAETVVDPTSGAASAAVADPAPNYTYDSATGRWNSDKWQYDAGSGQYGPVSTPGPVTPTGPSVTPGASGATTPSSNPVVVETPSAGTAPTPPLSSSTGTSNPTTVRSDDSSGTGGSQASNGATGGSSTNSSTTNTIGNSIGSNALSGSAGVISNTNAGSAASGGASVAQTVINTINSSVGGNSGSGVANFVADITGDVYGDMVLSPMMLGAMLSNAVLGPPKPIDTTINNANNNQITNTIDLNATSGDATVNGNTNAGNATTGPANAVANVMNIINSIIAANQSFVGTINIYGNLDGDILIAPDFLPQLLASNASDSRNSDGSLTVNLNDTQAIVNNVNLSAASGAAVVAGNTNGGNATTGAAATKLTILNLTGHEVVASNSLLVFVNVLGKWVGVIVDAPAGATAAAVGNGITKNTVAASDSTLNSQNNSQITNNINIAAQSGDAAVTRNTNAGDATSGDATASANILNMSQSSFGVSGWFGVLFINVMGEWLGNFGVNSPHGDPRQPAVADSVPLSSAPVPDTPQAVAFVPKQPTVSVPPIAAPVGLQSRTPLLAVSDLGVNSTQSVGSIQSQRAPLGFTSSSLTPTGTPSRDPGYSIGLGVLGAILLLGATIRSLWPVIHRILRRLV